MFAPNRIRRQRGASLVSVMVGLVVGLLVALTAMGSLTFFSASQRQSGGVNSTLGSGLNAISAFKHELAQAGRGFMLDGAPICARFNIGIDLQPVVDNQPLLPVEVSRTGGGALVLDIRYASALEAATPVVTRTAMNVAADRVELNNFLPVAAGQAVLLAPASGGPGSVCTVATVTQSIPSDGVIGQQLVFGGAGMHNQAAPFPLYPIGSRVFLLGNVVHTRFTANGRNLVMERPLENTQAVLAEGVRAFDIELGVTDGVSETLSAWTRADENGAQGLDWSVIDAARLGQVRALRVGLIVQSTQAEKPDAQGNCQATTEAPMLFGQAVAIDGRDTCFRFRNFTTVVPMRNLTPVRGAI